MCLGQRHLMAMWPVWSNYNIEGTTQTAYNFSSLIAVDESLESVE